MSLPQGANTPVKNVLGNKQLGEGCDRLFVQVIEKEKEAKQQLQEENEGDFVNTDKETELGNENNIEPDEHKTKHIHLTNKAMSKLPM